MYYINTDFRPLYQTLLHLIRCRPISLQLGLCDFFQDNNFLGWKKIYQWSNRQNSLSWKVTCNEYDRGIPNIMKGENLPQTETVLKHNAKILKLLSSGQFAKVARSRQVWLYIHFFWIYFGEARLKRNSK